MRVRMTTVLIMIICAIVPAMTAATGAAAATRLPGGHRDADIVVLLPGSTAKLLGQEKKALRPLLKDLREQHVKVAIVPLARILQKRAPDTLTAEDVRSYLRATFTWRTSTLERPRYLAIFSPPRSDYFGVPSEIPVIPRFEVSAGGELFETDVPFEFTAPPTIDGGDGSVDPGDLDMTSPNFDVFRVPSGDPAGIATFVQRHTTFGAASYRNDVTLVSGEFGLFAGDTSVVQCINASNLTTQSLVTRVFNVYDSTASSCTLDLLTKSGGPTLADFLESNGSGFQGGTIIDISHGNGSAVYGKTSGLFFQNFGVNDAPGIPADRLNVFISIACDNDSPGYTPNLAAAMYQQSSVAVISATTSVTPVNLDDILFAEVDSVTALFSNHHTLAQRLHAFRSDYYTKFVLPAAGDVQSLLWINTLTENLVGDGLVTVAH